MKKIHAKFFVDHLDHRMRRSKENSQGIRDLLKKIALEEDYYHGSGSYWEPRSQFNRVFSAKELRGSLPWDLGKLAFKEWALMEDRAEKAEETERYNKLIRATQKLVETGLKRATILHLVEEAINNYEENS